MSLIPFWTLNGGNYVAMGDKKNLLDFIKNILICVPQMKEGLWKGFGG